STGGGTNVTITGEWDEETVQFTTVMFGEVPGSTVEPAKKNAKGLYVEIITTSPPHALGPVPITIVTPGGKKIMDKDQFTYEFKIDINPKEGENAKAKNGDLIVAITGDNLADVSAVQFGDTYASFWKLSPSRVWSIVPNYPEDKNLPEGGAAVNV